MFSTKGEITLEQNTTNRSAFGDCRSCPYPSVGFCCRGKQDCLRTRMDKLNDIGNPAYSICSEKTKETEEA